MTVLNEIMENLRCKLGITHKNPAKYIWLYTDEASLWDAVAQHYIGENFPTDPTGNSMRRLLRELKADGWVIGSLIRK